MKFFLPKDRMFFNYLENSSQNLVDMAGLLAEVTKVYKNFEVFGRQAKKIEHLADENVHKTVRWLNQTFITPFDREDIYLMVLEFDDIIDLMEEVVHDLDLYRIKKKPLFLKSFCKLISEDVTVLAKLFSSLESSKANNHVQGYILKIHDLEDEGDALYDAWIMKIFKEIKNPIEIIKMKDVCDKLEKIMDKFQKLSDVIEGLLMKYN